MSGTSEDADRGGRWIRRHESLLGDGVIGGVLIAVAFFGLAASDANAGYARTLWYASPVGFLLGELLMHWLHGGPVESIGRFALRRGLHWLGAFAALHATFFLVDAGRFTMEDAGLASGLVMGLAAFLAGVHGQWRFAPIGLGIMAASVLIALVEEHLWLLLALSFAALIGVLAVNRLQRRPAVSAGAP